MNEELWADVVGYEGLYKISNNGRVLSLSFNKTQVAKIMAPQTDRYGYTRVGLCGRGKQKYCLVHRLVAEAFISNTSNLAVVNHIDGVKTNNEVSNLEWTTSVKNSNHAKTAGLYRTGNTHPMAKLSWDDVTKIRNNTTLSGPKLALKFGVSSSVIYSILSGKTWRTDNYHNLEAKSELRSVR